MEGVESMRRRYGRAVPAASGGGRNVVSPCG
jgi:hypothetical protein